MAMQAHAPAVIDKSEQEETTATNQCPRIIQTLQRIKEMDTLETQCTMQAMSTKDLFAFVLGKIDDNEAIGAVKELKHRFKQDQVLSVYFVVYINRVNLVLLGTWCLFLQGGAPFCAC